MPLGTEDELLAIRERDDGERKKKEKKKEKKEGPWERPRTQEFFSQEVRKKKEKKRKGRGGGKGRREKCPPHVCNLLSAAV